MKASIRVSKDNIVSKIDDRIYSSFVEHMGRAIYTGIYEPYNPTADEFGFRKDVMDLVRPLNLSHIRYPGGNFLSGYRWKDGIGPKEERPARLDLAWFQIEPNLVGTDEFLRWCERLGVEPMLAVNLGTGTPQDAADLVEYVNGTTPTYYAQLRARNGHKEPYNVKLWCLGNEMDGPWQICGKTAEEYGRIAHETAKMMKWIDPDIELVACGSSNTSMKTYGEWEKTVLKHCYQDVNYVSLHSYYRNDDHDNPTFLASNIDMENMIQYIGSICKQAKLEQKGDHDVYLSFDEWNVWYHYSTEQTPPEKWVVGRAIDQEDYDDVDTLVVGTLMNALIRNADMVKISCFAQLINVIAPITTEPGGRAYVRTIYKPLMYASNFGRGTSIKPIVDAPTYDCKLYKDVSFLDSAVVLCDDGSLSVFVVNRNENEDAELTLDFTGISEYKNAEVMTIRGMDTVTEKADVSGNCLSTKLLPLSWNLIRLS